MNEKTLTPGKYKHVLCRYSVHRVQFVPLSLCSHLRTAFMRAPGVGSGSTAAIILQTERVEGGKREYRDKTQAHRVRLRERQKEKCEQNKKKKPKMSR